MGAEVSESEFESFVREALDGLPDEFAKSVENVAISVEDYPDPSDMITMGLDPESDSENLLGLYVGYPRTEQGNWDVILPDKISIYREAICRHATGAAEVKEQVRKTVFHELGHYFGLSDQRLHDLGWA